MTEMPPYHCTGFEASGIAEFFSPNGDYVTALASSNCFAGWYCAYLAANDAQQGEYTWRWRDGVDPADPTTWPDYAPPAPQPPPEP